jgi:hypothetical protein
MPQKPEPQNATAPKKESNRVSGESAELSATQLDQVSGGLSKLPGKRKPPTFTPK